MAGIENDINRLENLLRDLKVNYDQFFKGEIRVAPDNLENQLQVIIRNYGTRGITNPRLRFRYLNLVARYNSLRTLWTRKRRELEEGRFIVPKVAGRKESPEPKKTPTAQKKEPAVKEAAPPAPASPPASVILKGDPKDEEALKKFYKSYEQAPMKQGEKRLSYAEFSAQLTKIARQHLGEGKAVGIKFQLSSTEGKVKITSRPLPGRKKTGEKSDG